MSRTESPPNPLPWWKRALDLLGLLVLAPALIPVMALLALFVRISSPGPIFFRQERVGLHTRRFVCLKFRTMRVAAETKSHQAHLEDLMNNGKPMEKLDVADERITPGGLWLRASGLDELPQVFNILRGEMSLVGPRPCVPYEYNKFQPEHRARFDAVPGLTGLWQVSGKNNTTFQQMIDLDIAYATKLSFWRDVSILVRTFPVLLQQVCQMLRKRRERRRINLEISGSSKSEKSRV
ncbi:MAG TPA: sugar transferase [Candidatus Acidoferrum sp.]|nr:sugar transferase [Candidatus Acidoferrum sp.]